MSFLERIYIGWNELCKRRECVLTIFNMIPILFLHGLKLSNPTSNERIYAINDRYGGNRFLFGCTEWKSGFVCPW